MLNLLFQQIKNIWIEWLNVVLHMCSNFSLLLITNSEVERPDYFIFSGWPSKFETSI